LLQSFFTLSSRTVWFLFFFLCIHANGVSQTDFNGVWQGILVKDGQKTEQGFVCYANFSVNGTVLEGKTREEIINTPTFAVKRIKGSVNGNNVVLKQFVIEKKSRSADTWCTIDAQLSYNDSTGYLSGIFQGNDCKRYSGKIILYKSDIAFAAGEENPTSHAWTTLFFRDLKKGYNAPIIREKERKNFSFQPIYFDYDKTEIKPEYVAYLLKIIRVVDSHSDLRIKITGNTDADGSEVYNLELSKKRAKALLDFFTQHGLSADRVVLDFKGETAPIDSNKTPEGKQKNRRVDFSFI
jgi:OOP family OmpA-OmpF porin